MTDSTATDEQDDRAEEPDSSQEEKETESGDDPEEIEAEREERLDPENRPENAEVDNTQRDFDAEKGTFTDRDDYDEVEPKFVADDEL
jgi:hypothetical protein